MANPLVAQAHSSTTWNTGLGLVEDAAQISNGIQNNSWVDGTLGTVGGALDIIGLAIDPLGSLVAWGVSWLMEHVKPLKDALDWLAGNPDEIAAHAQTWGNVSKFTAEAGQSYQDAIRFETATWVGESGDAYREHAGAHLAVLEGIAKATNGISYAVMGAGLLVGLVRGIVRDLIAQFVATLAARLPQWLAEVGFTLGIGTPVVVGQVVALVAKWVNKIQGFIRALLNSMRRLKPMLGKLGDILTELKALLKKMSRSNPLTREADDVNVSGGRTTRRPRDGDYEGIWAWADDAYDHIRSTDDAADIARHLDDTPRLDGSRGFTPAEIEQVRQHVFFQEHPIDSHDGSPPTMRRFDSDSDMAEAWLRLRSGNAQPADVALLEHELAESRHLAANPGASYRDAHQAANQVSNWESQVPPSTREDYNS